MDDASSVTVDLTSPVFDSSIPDNGETEISIADGYATLTFDDDNNILIADQSKIAIDRIGGSTVKDGASSTDSDDLLVNYADLSFASSYMITIDPGAVMDEAGNLNDAQVHIFFSTHPRLAFLAADERLASS